MKLLATAELLAFRTVNPLNLHELPFARAERAKRERNAGHMCSLSALPPRTWSPRTSGPGRFVVRLTRVTPANGKLLDDHDALPASLKHIVDGICDRLGVDDGDRSKVRFEYAPQERGPWAVRWTIHLEELRPPNE